MMNDLDPQKHELFQLMGWEGEALPTPEQAIELVERYVQDLSWEKLSFEPDPNEVKQLEAELPDAWTHDPDLNLDIDEQARQVLEELDIDLEDLDEQTRQIIDELQIDLQAIDEQARQATQELHIDIQAVTKEVQLPTPERPPMKPPLELDFGRE
jgi:DNA repair ATPase RecN